MNLKGNKILTLSEYKVLILRTFNIIYKNLIFFVF